MTDTYCEGCGVTITPPLDTKCGCYPEAITKLERQLAEAREALAELVDHTHDCERRLTEDLYHMTYCGESSPLINARATLKDQSQ